VLGDTVRLLHFPAMSVDEFTKIVVPAALLDVDEENAVFRALLGACPAVASAADAPSAGAPRSEAASDAAASPATASASSKAPCRPSFPRNSRNFVATRCDLSYDGFMRHGASSSSLFRGSAMPHHRNGWTITMYCDHSIKVNKPKVVRSVQQHVSYELLWIRGTCDLVECSLLRAAHWVRVRIRVSVWLVSCLCIRICATLCCNYQTARGDHHTRLCI